MFLMALLGHSILASSDDSDEGGAAQPPPRKKLRSANSTSNMQQQATTVSHFANRLFFICCKPFFFSFQAKNGCSTSTKDSTNGSAAGDDGPHALKEAKQHGSLHLQEPYVDVLDGLVEPKVISKTDQEIVRIIGQHLTSIGLKYVFIN